MNKSLKRLTSRRRLLAGTFAALACVLTIALALWIERHQPPRSPADVAAAEPPKRAPASGTSAPWPRTEPERTQEPPEDITSALYPAEVLGNSECRIKASKGTAVVIVPDRDGARFAMVDTGGVAHLARLSFWPKTFEVATRADGTVLAAFGDLNRQKGGRPDPDARWPVAIYLDDQRIFDHDHVWQFGTAVDGSSYYVVEPLAGDTSRLIIRNLEEGTEHSHDIGTMATSSSAGALPYSIRYTMDDAELHFKPGIDGVGTHYFYPTSGARRERREIRVSDRGEAGELRAQSSLFQSSEVGYVSYWLNQDQFLLVAYERDWDSQSNQAVQRWSRVMEWPDSSYHNFSVSNDGSLLLVRGWTVRLLDTATGESRFAMPVVDREAQMERLASVIGPDAGPEQVGAAMYVDLVGRRLHIGRGFSEKRDGFEGRAVDIFDLEGIGMETAPIRRFTHDAKFIPCSPEATSERLRSQGGQLVYGRKASPSGRVSSP